MFVLTGAGGAIAGGNTVLVDGLEGIVVLSVLVGRLEIGGFKGKKPVVGAEGTAVVDGGAAVLVPIIAGRVEGPPRPNIGTVGSEVGRAGVVEVRPRGAEGGGMGVSLLSNAALFI